MQTCEAPDFWGLHKKKNCAFPLKAIVKSGRILKSLSQNGIMKIAKIENLSHRELEQIIKINDLPQNELEQIAKMRKIKN